MEDHTATTSPFAHGDRRVTVSDDGTISLPSRAMSLALAARYFDFAAPTYRFLHRPTAMSWLEAMLTDSASLSPLRQAIIYLVMATASLYATETNGATGPSIQSSEPDIYIAQRYFQAAQRLVRAETGKATLESVQARLASVLFLLNTSRLNEAWYTFGTTYQLAIALGLHRRRSTRRSAIDHIEKECRRRCYWAAYTLDTYLSVILGRPALVTDHGVDQSMPTLANDDEISEDCITRLARPKDCITAAPYYHTKLARIVREASVLQDHASHTSPAEQVVTAKRLNKEIVAWQDQLPAFLSGDIHPSSLIPLFRRQQNVLQVANAHATMIVNRPFILSQHTIPDDTREHVDICLHAAKKILHMVMDMAASNQLFSAFWNTQVRSGCRGRWSHSRH